MKNSRLGQHVAEWSEFFGISVCVASCTVCFSGWSSIDDVSKYQCLTPISYF